MATIATMTMLKPARIVARSAPPPSTSGSGVSLRSLSAKKGGLSASASASPAAAAMAGAFFQALASSDAALAAQRVADVAAADAGSGDNRGQLLLIVVAPAIGWVLYNILQPALNQLNRMRSQALVAGVGLGAAAAAAGMACAPEASAAQELAALAAAAAPADDNRGLLLLIVVTPAIGWVLFNILQPALNQLNRMRSD
ncbi:photosystem II core complex proteins psbY, chloroplastic [Panicum miliaceum]|uniref:Photosystem II core complex proteins psbY, chloroplastic n=1 Tax=Panicum miliaceum TaxID=4540 RepID=A0A3L6RM26_PANMI|nr:photosystem II core complex proteins psbY, chloroplastic [Panicum miliaceum]